jgi:hypothetical protein
MRNQGTSRPPGLDRDRLIILTGRFSSASVLLLASRPLRP